MDHQTHHPYGMKIPSTPRRRWALRPPHLPPGALLERFLQKVGGSVENGILGGRMKNWTLGVQIKFQILEEWKPYFGGSRVMVSWYVSFIPLNMGIQTNLWEFMRELGCASQFVWEMSMKIECMIKIGGWPTTGDTLIRNAQPREERKEPLYPGDRA